MPAVVGSFPEPFLNGVEGVRLPVRVECASPTGPTCRTVTAHLRAAGVSSGLAELGPAGEEPDTLRLLVGTWSQVSGAPGARTLERGPSASGVYARPAASGRSIALLDAQGATVRTLTGTAGLIAATRYTEQAPEWLITGTTSPACSSPPATSTKRRCTTASPSPSPPKPASPRPESTW